MIQFRALQLESPNDAERSVEASLSSETPVFRPGLGREILSHQSGAIDLSRSPLPVITSHSRDETPVGIVENLRVAGGKLRGTLRFGGSQRALDVWEDVKAGVLRSVSIGYQIITGTAKGEDYLVSRWMPYEASLVAVPADPSVGIGRSFNFEGRTTMETNTQSTENHSSRSQRRAQFHNEDENRNNINEIFACAEVFKVPLHEVREFISSNGPDHLKFRNFAAGRIKDTGSLRFAEPGEIGMSDSEVGRYSFIKAIMAKVDPAFGQRHAGFEMEASRAVADKLGRQPQGLFVPHEVLMSRDLTVGTPAFGGYLRPTEHHAEGFIDLLRNATQVLNLGATELKDLRGDVTIPSKTGSGTAYWVTEGNAPAESGVSFGQVTMSPKTVGGWIDYTRKLMIQASPDIETLVRADLAGIIAVEMDRVAINGSGVGAEPLGVLNTTGVGAVAIGANGGAPTWSHMLQLEEALATANADIGRVGYITNAKVRRKLKETTKVPSDAGAGFIWETATGEEPGFGRVNGYRAAISNNAPSDLTKGTSNGVCSAIIMANWADLIIGGWGALDLLVDPYSLGTSGGFRVVALLDCDIAIRRVASFAAIKDALTS